MTRIKIKDLPKDMEISKQELRAIIGGSINSTGDVTQLANEDLQNTIQQQQQIIQTLSNVSKLLNDTALAVTRKIG